MDLGKPQYCTYVLRVAQRAGNADAVKRLVRERAPAHGKRLLQRVWGVRKEAGGALALPEQVAPFRV